jgi:type IV secretory pathway VirB2 component (pilin)
MKSFRNGNVSGFGRKLATITSIALACALEAHASTSGLPWEKPMTAIGNSLSGPVAYSIGLIGIVASGATMLFGHDLPEFARKGAMVGLGAGTLVFAAPLLQSAFGVSAAII